MLDSVSMQRAQQDLLSHQMVGNTLAWWQGDKAILEDHRFFAMTIWEFRELFDASYVPNSTRELMRDQFRELRHNCMNVQAYTK